MKKKITKVDFYKHLRIYLIWCVLFFIINKVTSPGVNWFIYPILGWGISVFIQAIKVLFPTEEEKISNKPKLTEGNKEDDLLQLKPLLRKKWSDDDIV
ncbi:MAG: hypothetical protein RLZZ417_3157 [Bacteroidota bacterium]|jgi:hypothetical protein